MKGTSLQSFGIIFFFIWNFMDYNQNNKNQGLTDKCFSGLMLIPILTDQVDR